MKKVIRKLIAFAALIAVMLAGVTACEEEVEVQTTSDENEAVNTQETVADDEVLVVDGKRMEWKFNLNRASCISKGLIADESGIDDPDTALEVDTVYCYSDPSKKYLALKVYRTSKPGRYFYIMIDNLAKKPSYDKRCSAYDFNNKNAEKYGYLYEWPLADQLKSDLYMILPDYRANGRPTKKLDHIGRLPNTTDINDLMEAEQKVGADNPKSIHDFTGFDMLYYDAFLCGLKKGTKADCDKSFGGFKYYERNESLSCGWFGGLNGEGFYQMEEGKSNNHLFFTIKRHVGGTVNKDYDYIAYIGHYHYDNEGSSVRYVFEPKYQ